MSFAPPLTEAPILIESVQRGDHHHYDSSNTSACERRPAYPQEVWIDLAAIPAVPPARTAFPGTVSGVVSGISDVVLTPVPGNDYQFESVPDEFLNMVPANYNEGAYQPTLRDALGDLIPYNPSIWVADGVQHVVEFKYRTPAQLGYTLPLSISYWQYIGMFPAGGIVAIDNVGTGGGDVWRDTTLGVAHLRRIAADPAAGNGGIAVSTVGNDVRVGNTMSGTNLGAGGPGTARVFSAKTGADLEFRRVVAGANVTVTEGINDITIAAIPDGGVLDGDNLGGGNEVFINVTGTTMNFRTLTAGPGLGMTQNAPTANIIQVTADEVDAAGTDLVPATLDLFVSTLGNDTTGDGTAGLPFLTLDRAFREVRVVGYDDSASVTIQAAGSPFPLQTGLLSTNSGTRGRRQVPLLLRGERTSVFVGIAIGAVAQDASSGLYDLTIPPTAIVPGQILRFTAGAMTGIEVFVAEVVSPTVVRIPYSDALVAPAPGDTFDVDALATTATFSEVDFEGRGDSLVIRDLILATDAIPFCRARFVDQDVYMSGVWLANNATGALLVHENGPLQCGGSMPSAAGVFTYEFLGAYFDNRALGGTLVATSDFPTRLLGCVAHGNSAVGNLAFGGAVDQVVDSYFARIATVQVSQGSSLISHVWFNDCFPSAPTPEESGGGALEVITNAAATADFLHISTSTQHGLKVSADGELTLSATSEFTDAALAAVRVERGGHLICEGTPVVAGPGDGYQVAEHSRMTALGAALVADNMVGSGVAVTDGSTLRAIALNCSGNGAVGLSLSGGAEVVLTGDLTCTNNVGTGVDLTGARMFVGGEVTANSASVTATGAVILAADSHLRCGDLTANLSAAPAAPVAIAATGGSSIVADTVTAVGNGAGVNAVVVIAVGSGSRMEAEDVVVHGQAANAAAIGVQVSNAELRLAGTLTITGATTGTGLEVDTGSIVSIDQALSVTGNGTNLTVSSGSKVAASEVTATGALAAYGITVTDAAVSATGDIDVSTAAAGTGLNGTRAAIVCGGVFTSSNCGVNGITMASSSLKTGGGLTASTNQSVNIQIGQQSSLQVGGSVTANDTAVSHGIQIDSDCQVDVGGVITAIDNTDNNILIGSGSQVVCAGGVTATGAGNEGIRLNGGTLRCGGNATADNNNGFNIRLEARSLMVVTGNTAASNSTTGSGIRVFESSFRGTSDPIGTVIANNNTGVSQSGIIIGGQGSFRVGGIVIANGANSAGFSINSGSTADLGTIQANNNGSGMFIAASSVTVAGSMAMAGNTGAGLSIAVGNLDAAFTVASTGNGSDNVTLTAGSRLNCGFTLTTTGSTGGNGIQAVSSTVRAHSIVSTGNSLNNIILTASTLDTEFQVTASSSTTGNGIFATGSTLRIGTVLTASTCPLGSGIFSRGSDITVGNGLITSSNVSGMDLQQSRVRALNTITANTNTTNGILASTASTVAATAGITVTGGAVTAFGIRGLTWSSVVSAALVTVTNCTTNNINMAQSIFQAAGGVTSTGAGADGVALDISRLDSGNNFTSTGSTGSNLVLNNGSAFTCAGSVTLTGSTGGSGLLATNSALAATGNYDTSGCNMAGVILTRSRLLGTGNLVSSTSATGRGIDLIQAVMELGGTLTASTNSLDNIRMSESTLHVIGTLTANTSTTGRGISMSILSKLAVSSTGVTNITGNATGGILAISKSDIAINGDLITHTTNASPSISMSLSKMTVGGACTLSTATSSGTKVFLNSGSELYTTNVVSVITSSGGDGVSLNAKSKLICGGLLTATGNSRNLIMSESSEFQGQATISNATTSNITMMGGSQLRSGVLTIIKSAGPAITDGLSILGGSKAVVGQLLLSGFHVQPLTVASGSEIVITNELGGVSTFSGAAGTTPAIISISNGRYDLNNITVSGTGTTATNILLSNSANGRIATAVSSNSNTDGIRLESGSRAKLSTISGVANTGVGVRLFDNSHVAYTVATMTVTGAADCQVGVNAAKAWALMDTGQLQHVNDWSFPAGAAPLVTSVTQTCSCQPGT